MQAIFHFKMFSNLALSNPLCEPNVFVTKYSPWFSSKDQGSLQVLVMAYSDKSQQLSTLNPRYAFSFLSSAFTAFIHLLITYLQISLFYLPNRCLLWWDIPKHELETTMVISLVEAGGLPPIPPWSTWNAGEWLAGELFHIVTSIGKEKARDWWAKTWSKAICYLPPLREGCLACCGKSQAERR